MNAVLMRTGSSPVQGAAVAHGLLKISIGDHDSITGILFPGKNHVSSPRSSLHLEKKKKKNECSKSIRRTVSETDMIQSVCKVSSSRRSMTGSQSFPVRIPEEVEEEEEEEGGAVVLKKGLSQICDDRRSDVLAEELEYSGGGFGKGKRIGRGGGGLGGGDDVSGGNADQNKISAYYKEMLKANPGNPLLLRNYGKFLHEVERDTVKAEECYERAILANPGDGEVLSLYGKLIWEAHRDGERAEAYFDQALKASPDDCFVLGSYAHFLWDAEEEEDEEEEVLQLKTISTPALVEAF